VKAISPPGGHGVIATDGMRSRHAGHRDDRFRGRLRRVARHRKGDDPLIKTADLAR
jgi:hypothetical protein